MPIFALNFVTQLALFLLHAAYEKKMASVPRILLRAPLHALVPGLLSDLIGGKYLGLATYALGFGPINLFSNALLLYGLFVAHILLMEDARPLYFSVWILFVTAVYEVMNLFIPLYTYSFQVLSVEYVFVAFGGPLLFAIVVAGALQLVLGYRFRFFDTLIKKGNTPRKAA